ncbi:MAG TPA: hypothetical protein VF120_18090 [Ktedonobacterales bacterium]
MQQSVALIKGLPPAVRAVIVAQAQADSTFARKMGAAFEMVATHSSAWRASNTPEAPNPYEGVADGPEAVQSRLAAYDAATLRKVIKMHHLDPGAETKGWREPARLAAFIAERVVARHRAHEVFR